MLSEKEIQTQSARVQLAEEVHQALLEQMQKAIAAQKWEQLASIVLLLQGSQVALPATR